MVAHGAELVNPVFPVCREKAIPLPLFQSLQSPQIASDAFLDGAGRVREADFHHSPAVQIAIGIPHLLHELAAALLPWRIGIYMDGAPLHQRLAVNRSGIDSFHFFQGHAYNLPHFSYLCQ